MRLIVLEYHVLGKVLKALDSFERGDEVSHLRETLIQGVKLLRELKRLHFERETFRLLWQLQKALAIFSESAIVLAQLSYVVRVKEA